MSQKLLNKVTITGADDNTSYKDLEKIEKKYPFVEWGILISKDNFGKERYPSLKWINALPLTNDFYSFHLCGQFARDILEGNWSFLKLWKKSSKLSTLYDFDRMQLNLGNVDHPFDKIKFAEGIKENNRWDIILQNDQLLRILQEFKITANVLFDSSGGNGILPNFWLNSIPGIYCGYAGGLNHSNLKEQLNIIADKAEPPIWIDVESGVRTNNKLDLNKCQKFLDIASKYL